MRVFSKMGHETWEKWGANPDSPTTVERNISIVVDRVLTLDTAAARAASYNEAASELPVCAIGCCSKPSAAKTNREE